MKKTVSVLLVLLSLVMILPTMVIGVSASSAYQTYTYSLEGDALYSPDAYSAEMSLTAKEMGLDVALKDPTDIVTDSFGNVYIADAGNNRIVVLDRYYKCKKIITSFLFEGIETSFSKPQGVFVNDTSLWICDTGNSRLIEFDRKTLEFEKKLDAPTGALLNTSSSKFEPISMAVDRYGRIYVAAGSQNGLHVMNSKGDFVGYIGKQAEVTDPLSFIAELFRSDDQKDINRDSTKLNSVAITPDGYIYVTTEDIPDAQVSSAIKKQKGVDGTYMPVKLLNPAGDEIMRRNGFWPPAGEIAINTLVGPDDTDTPTGPSKIADVAVGPAMTWSIIDRNRSKVYTYDYNGNLLFAFGDKGTFLGSIGQAQSITYQEEKMLILDKKASCIVVYNRTEYGDMLIEAINAENSLNFEYAIGCWEKVLQRNSNFDTAYVGIGNAYYRSADYEEALAYYENAYDTENWSESYKMVRKEWMSTWLIPMVLGIIALLVLVVKFFGWAAKVNKRVATDGKVRKTFGQELLYGFHLIFHPFDGFYDLKHERRGSVRASLVFVALAIVAVFYQAIGQGYVMNPTGTMTTIWAQSISVLVPLILFVVANWCLTTLFEGEGSFKDIFIASSYSLLPIPLFLIPATIASNWVTTTEAEIVTMIGVIALIWVGLLLFSGTMITHDYSLGKNLLMILCTIVAMVFIIFLVLLFSMLLTKLVGLVSNLITEIQYRV